jgi:DNA polymerase-4
VLVGGLGGRGVVAGASYESRVFGARSAMPMHQARRLIGVTAVVLPPRGAVYGVASRRVFHTVRAVLPVVEQLSFDEAFGEPAELAGATETEVEEFCAQLRQRVRDETGLIASVGAGSGKQIAKIASGLAKPDGIAVIRRADEERLLDGLAVRKLWGIGPVAEEKLHRLGIDTVGQLAALSETEVANILGATIGPALHRLARGIDDRPVAERAVAKQISAESTFAVDLTTLEELRDAIAPIAEHAHQRLCRDGRGARTVTVKLKKSDMSTLTRSATLPYATTDAAALAALARRLLLDPRQIGPIRLLGVGFSGLSSVRQDSLFPDLELTVSDTEAGADSGEAEREANVASTPDTAGWRVGDDVTHREFGHGWVQGAGHGVVTVRFETRGTGPGPARTFVSDSDGIAPANPLDSLDWPDYLAALAEAASEQSVDDVAQG